MHDVLFANGTKNTETAPKYDPNRLFRKGDKVEVVKNKGRLGSSTLPVGTRATVERDEEECDWVFLKADNCDKIDTVDAAYLKLVTPVEELNMYFVEHYKHSNAYKIRKGGREFAIFWDSHPHAKEAAEAECARLNAEYRKEQSDD
jgi:hypothetical protein